MATKSDLRDRLKRRLGLGVVSDLEKERLGEALNAGIARAYSDRVPGLSRETFVGTVPAELALDTAVTVAGSENVTVALTGTPYSSRVYPHDILHVDVGGTVSKFLLRTGATGLSYDVGIPISVALSGGASSKVIRRSLELPSSGQISSIHRLDSGGNAHALTYDPLVAQRDPFETGTAHFFEQFLDANSGNAIASLWPAPDDSTDQFIVAQHFSRSDLGSDSASLTIPDIALDAILERALMAYMTWVGTAIPTNAALMTESIRDTADSLKNAANPVQIITKQ